jgi:hypothetical protein
MKIQKQFLLSLLFVSSLTAISQVGIGVANPDKSAILDVSSSSKGLLTPRMTTVERNLISVPATGLLIYNTDEAGFNVFNGTIWKDFTTGYKTITGSGDIFTDVATDEVATGMTISPPAGTYDVNFNSVCKNAYGTTTSIVTKSIGQATEELLPLYNLLKALPVSTIVTHPLATYNDETILPGVYETATIAISGTVTLDANFDPDAIFVFRSNGAMGSVSVGSVLATIRLINGAQACNVFWLAEGAITIGASTTIKGVILSNGGALSIAAGTNLEGRMFTTMGAIAFGPGYAHMPSTYSKKIDLGSLAYFIMISGGGALSTAGVCDFSGGIATKAGAITVVGTANGAVLYGVNDTFQTTTTVAGENNIDSIADFSVYRNGVLIPDSLQSFNCNSGLKNINLHTVATVAAGEALDIRWKKTTAKLQLGNRTLTLIKIK